MLVTTTKVLLLMGMFLKTIYAEDVDLHQHDYQLDFTRVELVRYNKAIFKEVSIKTFKHNRTFAVFNITFSYKIDVDIVEAVVQVYKFMSNEYRLYPIRFALDTCKALAADSGGVKTALGRCGNFVGCPFRKDIQYYGCNVYPDPSKFPPLIPNGEDKIDLHVFHSSQEAALASICVSVSRPIKWWQN